MDGELSKFTWCKKRKLDNGNNYMVAIHRRRVDLHGLDKSRGNVNQIVNKSKLLPNEETTKRMKCRGTGITDLVEIVRSSNWGVADTGEADEESLWVNNVEREGTCIKCNVPMLLDPCNACASCPLCGLSKDYHVTDHDHTVKFEKCVVTVHKYEYRRDNHFCQRLNRFQAKQNVDIPDIVYQKIENELIATGLNVSDLTHVNCRTILKQIKCQKLYTHAHFIVAEMTGRAPPQFTANQEETMVSMFLMVENAFIKNRANAYITNDEDNSATVNPLFGRASILSIPYLCYKFVEMQQWDEFLDMFILYDCGIMKDKRKIKEHDDMFKQICNIVGWPFYRTNCDL